MRRPVCILSAFFILAVSTVTAQDKPIFEEDILPILELNCLGCHGSADPQAGLSMENISVLMKGGNNGKPVIPGKSEESLLFLMISGKQKLVMPPEPLLRLEEKEIALIKTWIDNGTPSINPPVEKDEPKPKEVAQVEPQAQPEAVKQEPAPSENHPVIAMDEDPFFKLVILPILNEKCLKCHGTEKPKAGLVICLQDCVLQEKFVAPAEPDKSLLYTAIMGISQKAMPPKSQPQLSDMEKELIRRWIVSLPKKQIEIAKAESPVTFEKDILPIFNEKCLKCHGTEKPKAGLVICLEDCVLQEKFVVASDPDKSLLYTAIMGISQKAMPPKSEPQLTDAEKDLIKRWIASLPATEQPIAKSIAAEKSYEHPDVISNPNVITFENQILPILNANCAGCHGGAEPKANLRVSEISSILEGKFVIPNQPDESRLYLSIAGLSEKVMPPNPMPSLTKTEIEIIKYWIAKGAPYQETKQLALIDEPPKTVTAAIESQYGDSQIGAVAFHPTKPLLAVGRLYEAQLFEYDQAHSELRLLAVLPGHSHLIRSLQFSPDGKLLAAGGGRPALQGEMVLWDVETHQMVKKIEGHRDNIYGLSFAPDSHTLASCSYDRTVILWDVDSGSAKATLEDHVDSVYDVQFNPDGSRLASVAGDRTVKIWDTKTGERLYTLSDAEKELYTVTFHPSGKFVAAGGVDRMIRVWELGESDGTLIQSKFAHDGAVLRLTYSTDGLVLYSTSDDRRIKAWDTETYNEKTAFEEQSDWVYGLDLNMDGSLLAAGRYDGTFDLYDTATGNKVSSPIQKGIKKVSSIQSFSGEKKKEEASISFAAAKSNGDENTAKKSVNTNQFEVGALEGTGTYPSFLSSLSPRVVTYGEDIEFTLRGKNLADLEILPDNKDITVTITGIQEEEIPPFVRSDFDTGKMIVDAGVPYIINLKINIPNSIAPGNHSLRVRTPLATTNALSFYVEEKEAINEMEGNNSYLHAQKVELPNILAGSMNTMGDVDVYAFDAAAGEELTFVVLAGAIGSGMDSQLAILNEEGNTIYESIEMEDGSDVRMGYRFETDGVYYLQITDSLLRNGGFYRVHVTKRPFITKVYPLGVQKGKETEVQIEGYNLDGKSTVSVTVPDDYEGIEYPLPFETEHGTPVDSVRLVVSENVVVDESPDSSGIETAQTVAVPVNINGRIYDSQFDEDTDYFRFTAKKDEPLVVEVAAQRFGSPLDSKIEILNEKGESVETATLRSVAETYTVLSDRDSRSRGIRLNSWKDFEIKDFVMVGSEIIQIERLPDYPDEDISFAGNTRRGWRTGFFGTTPSHHAVDTKVYKVEVHPPHSEFPPNGMPVHRLYAQNDDGGAPIHGKDSYFRFNAPEDGEYIVKVTDAQGHNHPDNAYQLSIHSPKPDFRLFVNADRVNVPVGSRIPISVMIDRYDGFNGEVMIDIPHLPEGFRSTLTHIPPGEESSSFLIEALPGANSTEPDARFAVDAYTKIDGEWVKRSGSFAEITVTYEPDIKCIQEPKEITLVPGGTAKITVKASRHNGFADRIPIDLRNLPDGVYVLDTGLNGIMITPEETERSFTIYAEPWVQPEAIPVFSVLEVETRSALGNVYATPPSVLNITVDPQAIAQSQSEFLQQKRKY